MNRKALVSALLVILFAIFATRKVPADEMAAEVETATTVITEIPEAVPTAEAVMTDNEEETENITVLTDNTVTRLKSQARRIGYCISYNDTGDGSPFPDDIDGWYEFLSGSSTATETQSTDFQLGAFPFTRPLLTSPFTGLYFVSMEAKEVPEEEPIPKMPPLRPDKENDDAIRSYIVGMARLYIDKIDYSFIGGESSLDERTTDCSGFVWQIYTKCGLSKSYGKYNTCTGIMMLSQDPESTRFTEIPLEDALPGDLIIYESTDAMKEKDPKRPYSHVAIYTGEGTVVHVTRGRQQNGCIESDMHYRGAEYDHLLHAIRVDLSPDTGRVAEVKRIFTVSSENGVFGILSPETIDTLTDLADDVSDMCDDALDASYELENGEDEEETVPIEEAVFEAVEDATEAIVTPAAEKTDEDIPTATDKENETEIEAVNTSDTDTVPSETPRVETTDSDTEIQTQSDEK